jgi:hypothetical protein
MESPDDSSPIGRRVSGHCGFQPLIDFMREGVNRCLLTVVMTMPGNPSWRSHRLTARTLHFR